MNYGQRRDQARQAARNGDARTAVGLLLAEAEETHIPDTEYRGRVDELASALQKLGDARGEATCHLYLGNSSALQRLMPHLPPVDRGRILAFEGKLPAAAKEMEAGGYLATAAILREKSGDFAGAQSLWSRLSSIGAGGADAYALALVHFNLSRAAAHCKATKAAHEASVTAVRLLEAAADHYESVGQRERAFDCFQVLIQVGKETKRFEDVLEGYVNCIRILREDNLKYFALQYHDEAIDAARAGKDQSAAAVLAREASEYARHVGLPLVSTHYVLEQARLWCDVATSHETRGSPPSIAENALLAAVLAYGEAGRFRDVGTTYRRLSELPLEEARQQHYGRAARRYDGVDDAAVRAAPLPAHLRQDNQFPDVWHIDVIEWEQQGSAAEAAGDILVDTRWPEILRRRAMLLRLAALAVESHPEDRSEAATQARIRVADKLAGLQLYAVLSPLEKLYARPEIAVKKAVVSAMRTLYFKRTFVTLRAALSSSSPEVVTQACATVEGLYFQHAYDPLARIVRESSNPAIRQSAIRALSHIDSHEAAEFLVGYLEHGTAEDAAEVANCIRRARGTKLLDALRAALPNASPPAAATIQQLLAARGF